jgi:hypothetical protein
MKIPIVEYYRGWNVLRQAILLLKVFEGVDESIRKVVLETYENWSFWLR